MALDFPANPVDGQEYNGYIWDDTEGYWKRIPLPPVINATDINDIDTAGAEDGNALIYDATAGQWVPGVAAPSGVKENTSDNINIDFSDNIPLETRAVTGDVTFTASNYTAGAHKTVYLTGDTVSRNLTFPTGWNFITDKPAAIGASKKNILDLNSFGTSESTTVGIWLGASSFEPIAATGGTETEIVVSGVTYRVHSFTGTESFDVAGVGDDATVEYLIVAGGGGGGSRHSGGGGAGGLLENTFSVVQSNYTATVGLGGAGGLAGTNNRGVNGGNSSIFGLTAIGGGGGGSYQLTPNSGGSGGGAGDYASLYPGGSGTPGQGYDGGSNNSNVAYFGGGGGGGAGAVGMNGNTKASGAGGDGGAGIASSITGNALFYAGGGGGASGYDKSAAGGLGGSLVGGSGGTSTSDNSTAGMDGRGGGGGAGGTTGDVSNYSGKKGGSGIVIIRYPITDPN